MHDLDQGTSLTPPVLLPRKTVSVDLQGLVLSILEALPGALAGSQNPGEGMTSLLSGTFKALNAVTIDTPIGDRAWRLIYRSLGIALSELLIELRSGKIDKESIKEALSQLDTELRSSDLSLGAEFFQEPITLPIIRPLTIFLESSAIKAGLSDGEARAFAHRLPAYFVASIHNEWQARSSDYDALLDFTSTPFSSHVQGLRERARYTAWLKKQIALPVFDEAFSLSDVYVPLRAFFKRDSCAALSEADAEYNSQIDDNADGNSDNEKKSDQIVVDLTKEIRKWMASPKISDPIKIISGGPGSGKSSFLKILAASTSDDLHVFPIYIPLQKISLTESLITAVTRYLNESGIFKSDPFSHADNTDATIILMLDGLDELTKPGNAADTIARDFLLELQRSLSVCNTNKLKVLAIVSGRTISIQKTKNVLRLKDEQHLRVMKYAYRPADRREFIDEDKMLAVDQRKTWWSKYAECKGIPNKIPTRLLDRDIHELSCEPLLNYLLVLSDFHKRPKGSPNLNRNEVYRKLLSGVHNRGYEPGRFIPTQALNDDEFELVMETVAVAAWYGDSRTATVEEIRARCNTEKLKGIFNRFLNGGGDGITKLIAAFYFQAASRNRDARTDEAFEFTHKSFGEYLTARRIIRALDRLSRDLLADQSERETPFDEDAALMSWTSLCGAAPIDGDLARFVRDEARMPEWSHRHDDWAACLSRLIDRALRIGMPTDARTGTGSLALARVARNSEEALWCVAGACASARKKFPEVSWPENTSAGALLHRIRGQRWPTQNNVLLNSFRNANFDGQHMVVQDMYMSDLSYASLVGSKLIRSELQSSYLVATDLTASLLTGVTLAGSDLTSSIFDNSSGEKIQMSSVSAPASHFRGAEYILSSMNLSDFSHADLSHSKLTKCNISKSTFVSAIFIDATIRDVDASGSNFNGADFTNATLSNVDFSGANLRGAKFEGSTISSCKIEGAYVDANELRDFFSEEDLLLAATEGSFTPKRNEKTWKSRAKNRRLIESRE